jgi:hypothetical protein
MDELDCYNVDPDDFRSFFHSALREIFLGRKGIKFPLGGDNVWWSKAFERWFSAAGPVEASGEDVWWVKEFKRWFSVPKSRTGGEETSGEDSWWVKAAERWFSVSSPGGGDQKASGEDVVDGEEVTVAGGAEDEDEDKPVGILKVGIA